MAMAIAVVVPIILTSVVYQRKYRQGTLQIV
jgi:PTS system trehalose-specific IIC component